MSTANGPIFRKSVSGYNKKDVNKYIEDISISAVEREEELKSKIARLESELEASKIQLEEALKRDFSEEISVYTDKIKDLETKVEDGTNLICVKNEYIEKLQTDLANATMRIAEMEESIKSAEQIHDKARQYEGLSRKLGEIMLGAGNTAEKIVSDANEKAAAMITEAESKRAHCIEILKKYTEKYCDKLSEVTVATAQERLDRINSEMAEFEASLSRSVSNARRQNGSVKEYIDSLRQSLDTSIETILNTTDTPLADNTQSDETNIDKMLESSVNDILSEIKSELSGFNNNHTVNL